MQFFSLHNLQNVLCDLATVSVRIRCQVKVTFTIMVRFGLRV